MSYYISLLHLVQLNQIWALPVAPCVPQHESLTSLPKISFRILGKSSHSHYIVCDDSGLLGIPCGVGSVPAAWLLLMEICDVQAFGRPYWAVHLILKHNPLGLGMRRFGLGNRDGPQMLLKPKLKNYVSCNNSKASNDTCTLWWKGKNNLPHVAWYGDCNCVKLCTVPVKSLDTPAHSRVFLYFYYFLHCIIIVKTLKLWNNTGNHVVTKKGVKQIKIYFIFEILQSSHPLPWWQLCILSTSFMIYFN